MFAQFCVSQFYNELPSNEGRELCDDILLRLVDVKISKKIWQLVKVVLVFQKYW